MRRRFGSLLAAVLLAAGLAALGNLIDIVAGQADAWAAAH